MRKAEEEERSIERCDKIHESLVYKHEHKGNPKEKIEQVKQILRDSLKRRKQRVEQASEINEAQFKKYEPLLEDIRTDSNAAMFGFFLINSRRLTMLMMAMYVRDMQWL